MGAAPWRAAATRDHDWPHGLFDDVPIAEPEAPGRTIRGSHPKRSFPALVPVNTLLLGRAEQAAVAIAGLSAYPAGLVIFVTARFRPRADGGSQERRPDAPGIWLRPFLGGGARSHFSRWWGMATAGTARSCGGRLARLG